MGSVLKRAVKALLPWLQGILAGIVLILAADLFHLSAATLQALSAGILLTGIVLLVLVLLRQRRIERAQTCVQRMIEALVPLSAANQRLNEENLALRARLAELERRQETSKED